MTFDSVSGQYRQIPRPWETHPQSEFQGDRDPARNVRPNCRKHAACALVRPSHCGHYCTSHVRTIIEAAWTLVPNHGWKSMSQCMSLYWANATPSFWVESRIVPLAASDLRSIDAWHSAAPSRSNGVIPYSWERYGTAVRREMASQSASIWSTPSITRRS